MATLLVTEMHALSLPRELTDTDATALQALAGTRHVDREDVKCLVTITDSSAGTVRVEYVGETSASDRHEAQWRLRDLVDRVVSARTTDTSEWHYRHEPVLKQQLARALDRSQPRIRLAIPIEASDRPFLRNDTDTEAALRAALKSSCRFAEDQHRILPGLSVACSGDHVVIDSPAAPKDVICIATSFLRASRAAPSPVRPPGQAVWAWASAGIAVASFGLSWTPLTWWTLGLLILCAALVASTAVVMAPRWRARSSATAIGLVPTLILVTFAGIYAAAMLLEPSLVTVGTSEGHELREPLLLSLSLLTTVGVLDFTVHDWVRSVAYLEMLLFAAVAGGAGLVAVRATSTRLREILTEVRRQRDDRPSD